VMNLQCSEPSCAMQESGTVPLIFDQEHFTAAGSLLIARKIRDAKLIL
jgi:hypothetical protein